MTRSARLFSFAGSVSSDFKGRVSTQREYSELSMSSDEKKAISIQSGTCQCQAKKFY